jgi:hypothetical protein
MARVLSVAGPPVKALAVGLSDVLIVGILIFVGVWLFSQLQGMFGKDKVSAAITPTGGGSGTGIFNASPSSSDPLVRAIFSSGDGDSRSWLTGGPFNDGNGQMGNLWAWIKQSFGIAASPASSPIAESNQQAAQEVGLNPASPWVTSDPLADQFNLAAPLQGGA